MAKDNMGSDSNGRTVVDGKIRVPFGKDSSDYSGSADQEQIKSNFGGSDTNLKHTLTGNSAVQQ